MSLASIQAALDTRLQSLVAFDPVNCAWPSTPYAPVIGTRYLAPVIVAITRRAIANGPNAALQWDGAYQVSAYFPSGEGTAEASARVDQILAHFPRGLTLTGVDGAILQFEASSPQPVLVQGAWAHGIARMPFFVIELP